MLTPIQVRDAILDSIRCVNVASKLGLSERALVELANNSAAALTGGCNVKLVDEHEDELERAA